MVFSKLTKYFRKISGRYSLASAVISIILLMADYFVSNMSFPLYDTSSRLSFYAFMLDKDRDDAWEEDYLFVNMAYDKELAQTYDKDFPDLVLGTTPITDRGKLIHLLRIASGSDYRYIFVDVRFEEGLNTENDSALFSLINKMPRIVVSTHREDEEFISNPLLSKDKTAMADYRVKRGNFFTRYEFLQSDRESVALRLFRELDAGEVKKTGIFFSDHGKLCYNTQFVNIPKSSLSEIREDGEIRFPYFSSVLLNQYSEAELKRMMKDKIIVVGDFDKDTHDVLGGEISGPLLHVLGYETLKEGKHIPNIFLQIFLFIVYFLISYIILTDSKSSAKRKNENGLFLRMLGFFLSAGCLLWIADAIIYFVFSLSFIIVLPTTVFTLLKYYRPIVNYKKSKNKQHK